MKKATLLLTILLLTLTGCGSSDSDKSADSRKASKEVSDEQSTSEESASAKKADYDELFLEKISEYPIELTGHTTSSKEVCLYMTEPTIDAVTKDGVTAHGISRDEFLMSIDELTITFLFDEATKDAYSSLFGLRLSDEIGFRDISRDSEERVELTPAVPFSVDLFNNNIDQIKIWHSGTPTESGSFELSDYSMSDFTVSLDPEGWKDSFRYYTLSSEDNNGSEVAIIFTDPNGNEYKTISRFEIKYKQPSGEKGYRWVFDEDDGVLLLIPLEEK